MGLGLYLDHQVPRAITDGLRLRGVDVLTAYEDGSSTLSDTDLLDRAQALGRALFTFDDDLLAIAAARQRSGEYFPGVIYAHVLRVSIGRCVEDLALVAEVLTPEELRGEVLFLPL